jgi:hypothetical protein
MAQGWRGRALRKSTAVGWRKPPPPLSSPRGTPKPPALGAQQQQQHAQKQREWVPTVRDGYPHAVGATVSYQRPDMAAPRIARVLHRGAHGAIIEHPDGSRAQARWESITPGKTGIDPKETDEAHAVLSQMGIEIDPVRSLLAHGQPDGADPDTAEHLKLLAAAGAPLRADRLKTASGKHVKALIDYLRDGDRRH